MNLLIGRIRRRVQAVILLVVLVFCVGSALHFSVPLNTAAPTNITTSGVFDIVKERTQFRPAMFHQWSNTGPRGPAYSCVKYWNQLVKESSTRLQNPRPGFELEPRIYKKKKWLISAKQRLRRTLHEQGRVFTDAHVNDLQAEYYRESRLVSSLEEHFVDSVKHLRVFGGCIFGGYTENGPTSRAKGEPKSDPPLSFKRRKDKAALLHLIPWLKNTADPLEELLSASKEDHGILVTIFQESQISIQVDHVARLIRLLRVQGNQLPIQIAYSGKETVPLKTQAFLTKVATSDSYSYISALDEVELDSYVEYPKQTLSFLEVDQFVTPDITVTDNIMYFVAAMFCDFKNMVVMNSQTIPMVDNLSFLFENEQFRDNGMLFFKDRPSIDSKPDPFPPGFFEVNELINQYASVTPEESAIFGMKIPTRIHTKRVTELGFQRLLDPSMAVLNKQKVMPGLVISSVLPFHPIIGPKYEVSSGFNPELLWLGQELAGTSEYVSFNKHFASTPGVLTPRENLPVGSYSSEICSSSWSQIYHDTSRLVYVTSHQLENRVLPLFEPAISARLSVNRTVDAVNEDKDDSLIHETIDKNILYIKSVLQPIDVEKAVLNDEGQPFLPTEHIDDFGSADDYWCSYDIVGSKDSANRGIVFDYQEKDSRRFLFYLNVWQQRPEG
ncbi:hypothetical protein JCM33374_g3115 [Metschnikowia sp. JCM 33374]|nr:hypothetical protein JCM33374_g3115 [Metschnikowia sp. JCM 33374]